MPLIFQHQIVSDDVHAHPDRLFLFGDNELLRGRGGQAAASRGNTNAVGVATTLSAPLQGGVRFLRLSFTPSAIPFLTVRVPPRAGRVGLTQLISPETRST
jgi:hypothetical protein